MQIADKINFLKYAGADFFLHKRTMCVELLFGEREGGFDLKLLRCTYIKNGNLIIFYTS